ncbi:hypothetical protein ACF3M2_16490 [Tissierella carlieri]|jgi:hypothetical protein|uniref:hypothetical protein n=1 Tax=Tissierella TaxID=41273 RepID=UPI0019128964|nr:hypothetical protein [Tissierella sp. P1]MDU5083533.1 hypothetical protein [Bacillota bacterium]
MRKSISLCLYFILALFILTSCEDKQDVVHMGVNAEILEISEQEKTMLVKGLDENSILGDKCYVKCEDAYFIEVVDGKPIDITFDDFSVKDKITVDVIEVLESYPSSTTTGRIQLIQRSDSNYDKISAYMEEECKNVFSPYYELLDFQISNYQEEVVNENVEATFFYKVIHKNYDKDPDTVRYIKEAKERGDSNYQQMYDEYLQPKEMNFELKAIMDKNDLITLYSNISPKGIEWEETKMSDFILSK